METKESSSRDYEFEREQLFNNSLKKINPRILKTIELIEKISNSGNQINFEITTSSTGTCD